MPDSVPLWRAVFGDDRPVEIEIGPGRGDVLLAFGRQHPERGFFGIERCAGFAEGIMERVAKAGVPNVRAVGGDARCIVADYVPPASVEAYHVYFPDPWHKRRHFHRKLFQPGFGELLRRTLKPNGLLFLATDLAHLAAEMERAVARSGFVRADDVPLRDRPQTKFERKYAGAGTYASVWRSPAG